MAGGEYNPWKLTTIVLLLVFATALATALVMASWGSGDKPAAPKAASGIAPRTVSGTGARPAAIPTAADIEVCNAQAKTQAGDKTTEVVKDAVIGGVVGAGVGAAGGAIAQGGKGAGKGAAIGGVVGATAGTLYGLNENKKNDVRYQEAYRQCMRGRGYVG